MSTSTEPKLIQFDPQLIDPSPYQPRKKFETKGLDELTASVKELGLIQPLVARESPTAPGRLELIVGERRLRASKAAGVSEVPVLLRVLDDERTEQMVLEENIQREDLTDSEEGHAFQRLLQMTDAGGKAVHTQESVAAMIHKNVDYVVSRLKLLVCPPELVEAVDSKLIAVSVAMLVGRIPDPKARAVCAKEVLKPGVTGKGPEQQVPLNYVQTKEMIREHFMVRLDKKQFDLDDASLVPVKVDEAGQRCQGGACMDCPFRSGNLEGVELQGRAPRKSGVPNEGGSSMGADAMLCTLPRCHKLKLDAAWQDKKLQAERAGKKTLDGPAAERAFGGHNGRLAYDSGYLALNDPGYVGNHYCSKSVKEAIKGQAYTVVLARHPETLELVELVERKQAEAALKSAAEAEKDKPKSKQEEQQEEEQKARRKKELRQQKIDKLALDEGVREIREAISSGRVKADERFQMTLFTASLGNAGSDGLKFLADSIELERDKKASAYDLEKPLKKWVSENCATAPQMMAMTVLALLAKSLHWNGAKDPDFQSFLALCGLKQGELERRARALLDADKKGKPSPNEVPNGKAGKNSSDPSDVSVEKEASKTAAADARAKSQTGLAAAAMLKGGISGNAKDFYKAAKKLVKPAPVKVVKASENTTEFAEMVKQAKAKKPWPEILGAMPAEGTKARKAWDALRVKVWKAAKKVKGAK